MNGEEMVCKIIWDIRKKAALKSDGDEERTIFKDMRNRNQVKNDIRDSQEFFLNSEEKLNEVNVVRKIYEQINVIF